MEDWYLQRQGYPGSRHHLNILLGTRDKLTVGRKAGGSVDIVCNGKTVSREHCYLRFVDSCWKVEDLGSMNGVYVNRNKIPQFMPTPLKVGDLLGVGAIDAIDPDYFVFTVMKNVIKDENENDEEIVPVGQNCPLVQDNAINTSIEDPLCIEGECSAKNSEPEMMELSKEESIKDKDLQPLLPIQSNSIEYQCKNGLQKDFPPAMDEQVLNTTCQPKSSKGESLENKNSESEISIQSNGAEHHCNIGAQNDSPDEQALSTTHLPKPLQGESSAVKKDSHPQLSIQSNSIEPQCKIGVQKDSPPMDEKVPEQVVNTRHQPKPSKEVLWPQVSIQFNGVKQHSKNGDRKDFLPIDDELSSTRQQSTSESREQQINKDHKKSLPINKVISTQQQSIPSKRGQKETPKDPKLSMVCAVVVEKLPKHVEKRARELSSSVRRKVPVNGKKRVYQLADSEDSDENDGESVSPSPKILRPTKDNHVNISHGKNVEKIAGKCDEHRKNIATSFTAKGKTLKNPCQIDEGRSEKGKALKKPCRSDEEKSEKEMQEKIITLDESNSDFESDVPSTSKIRHKSNNFVVEKLSNTVRGQVTAEVISSSVIQNQVKSTSNSEARFAPKQDDSDDNYHCQDSLHAKSNKYFEEDDEVIVLSSDEETFSVPQRHFQIKIERPNTPTKSVSRVDDEKSSLTSDECSKSGSSSSEDDGPFFPELSQPFLKEIEDEDQMDGDVPEKSRENGDDDKLKNLVSSGRFKPKAKTTLPIEPRGLPLHQAGRRFTLTTGRETARKETDSQKPEESIGQGKSKTSSVPQRAAMPIPMRPQYSKKRKLKSGSSVRDELCKKQELQSYVRSVNEANARPQGQTTKSLVDCPSVFAPPKKPIVQHKQVSNVPKAPKSSAPIPVKAKVTKRSRGDMLTADLVGPSEEANQRPSSGSNALAGYSIPKKPKLSCDDGDDELRQGVNPPPVTDSVEPSFMSVAFKPPPNRVARKTSETDVPSPSPLSKYSNKSEHRQSPRDEAQPLGRNRKWVPSYAKNFSNSTEETNGRKNNRRHAEDEDPPPGEESNHMNYFETRTPTFNNDQTIPLSASDNEKRCSSNQTTSDLAKTGILNYGTSRGRVQKRSVRFSDKNEIKEIEARSPTPTKISADALIDELMLRMCNWSFNWIAEQQNAMNRDEPPPILNEVKFDNRILPKLTLLPVVSAYPSLEAYFSIFHPLMIHEIWATICKEVNSDPLVWTTLVHAKSNVVEGCALLPCESLIPEGCTRLRDLDLVVLRVPLPKPNTFTKVFGVVTNVELRPAGRKETLDHRLLRACHRPDLRVYFTIRVKLSNAPPPDSIISFTKIMPLRTVMKQFRFNAELSRSLLCEVILDPADCADVFKLETIDVEDQANLNPILNPIQLKAVESFSRTIVNAPNYETKVALLQGPPGTGKSHVIVELVKRMLFLYQEKHAKRPRILICAPSNNAVDEIAYRLYKASSAATPSNKFQIVRIGVHSSMNSNIHKISLESLANELINRNALKKDSPESSNLRTLTAEAKKLSKTKTILIASIEDANKRGSPDEARVHGRKLEELESRIESLNHSISECTKTHLQFFQTNKERYKAKLEVIGTANVICTTLNSCRSTEMEELFFVKDYHREVKPEREFLSCIIDEASQCTEPESLTPLALGIRKLILIGDPDQLPATVASQPALKNRFDQSLFNRFYSSRMSSDQPTNEPVMMLNTQYRMAPSICEWPSKYFYGGALVTAASLARTGPCYDYRVLNVIDGQEQTDPEDGKSIMNDKEAQLVATIVQVIMNSQSTRGKTVGVITFYQSQKKCIEKVFKSRSIRDAKRFEVNTVDSFQGREKDIVIVSCVRARETGGDIGFVNSLQRMNVALTRAKESLIVCGHFQTLQVNEAWNDLVNNARNRDVAHVVTSDYTVTNLQPLLMRSSL